MVQKRSTGLSWDDLAALFAASRSRSVRAAAKKLGIAHTTLARRIASAERTLNVAVFVKSAGGLALTDDGDKLLPHIARMAEEMQALTRKIAGKSATPSGRVKITLPPAVLKYCLAPALPEFARAYPGLQIEFDTRYSISSLDRNEADIAIRYQSEPEQHLVGMRLGASVERAYASPALTKTIGSGSLASLIGWANSDAFRARAARLGLQDNPIGFVCFDLEGQVSIAENGLGIAILPDLIASRHASLRPVNPSLSVQATDVWLLMHDDLRHSARVRAVSDFLAVQIKKRLH